MGRLPLIYLLIFVSFENAAPSGLDLEAPVCSIEAVTLSQFETNKIKPQIGVRISVKPATYEIYGSNCTVHFNKTNETIQLTDEFGCSADKAIFTQWSASGSYREAVFTAPGPGRIRFECICKICYGSCDDELMCEDPIKKKLRQEKYLWKKKNYWRAQMKQTDWKYQEQ